MPLYYAFDDNDSTNFNSANSTTQWIKIYHPQGLKISNISFINNLNELYKAYPEVYDEINQTTKLPTKEDVEYISSLKEDFKNIKEHLNDDNYLDIINQ